MRSRFRRCARSAALAAAVAAASGAAVRAQAPPPPAGGKTSVTESANVSLVLLPVTVLDGKGEPIRGLTAADFEASDDGRPVRIESVDVDERPVSPPPSPGASVRPISVSTAPRKFVLVFDLSSPSPKDLADAKRAAEDFVKRRMEPGDLAAVATVAEGRHAAISRRFIAEGKAIAFEIGRVRPAAMSAAFRDPLAGLSGPMEPDAVARTRALDREFHDARASSLVDSLEELAGTLASVDGPKQVILFSRGERGIGGAASAFVQAQCEIDAVVTGGIAAAESSLSDRDYDDPRGEGGVGSLDALSRYTGGLLLRSGNDLPDQLERLLRAESVVYVLSFAPVSTGHPGRFHRVTVRVARDGTRVVCRPGYLEPAG